MAASGYQLDGLRIAQARGEIIDEATGKQITQASFAEMVDLHPVTMNRIESNKARVSLEVLERFVAATGLSRSYLLGEPEPDDEATLMAARRTQMQAAFEEILGGFEKLADLVEDLNARAALAGAKQGATR